MYTHFQFTSAGLPARDELSRPHVRCMESALKWAYQQREMMLEEDTCQLPGSEMANELESPHSPLLQESLPLQEPVIMSDTTMPVELQQRRLFLQWQHARLTCLMEVQAQEIQALHTQQGQWRAMEAMMAQQMEQMEVPSTKRAVIDDAKVCRPQRSMSNVSTTPPSEFSEEPEEVSSVRSDSPRAAIAAQAQALLSSSVVIEPDLCGYVGGLGSSRVRPCKSKRQRFRKLLAYLEGEISANPNPEQVDTLLQRLPPSIEANAEMMCALRTRMTRFAEAVLEKRLS